MIVYSTNGVRKTGYPHPKNEIGPLFYIILKNQLKMDCRSKHKPETVKLVGKNIEENLLDIDLGSDFLDMTPEAQATQAKINKWDYIKLKASAQQRKQSTE